MHAIGAAVRVAFLGVRGPVMERTFRSVADAHDVVLFVRPGVATSRARRLAKRILRRERPFDAEVRRRRIPIVWMGSRDDAAAVDRLRRARPDLIAIATFPWILPPAVFTSAALGAVNLHLSLLPRHRGATPTFATYLADDAEAGVTVHRVTAGADAGDILGQDRWPLERGTGVERLAEAQASHGSALMVRVLDEIERGVARGVPQDEAEATRAPLMPSSGSFVDFSSWPAERVWHVLGGLHPWYHEELRTADGRVVAYGEAIGWEATGARRGLGPGVVERQDDELIVGCIDGIVRLRAAPR